MAKRLRYNFPRMNELPVELDRIHDILDTLIFETSDIQGRLLPKEYHSWAKTWDRDGAAYARSLSRDLISSSYDQTTLKKDNAYTAGGVSAKIASEFLSQAKRHGYEAEWQRNILYQIYNAHQFNLPVR